MYLPGESVCGPHVCSALGGQKRVLTGSCELHPRLRMGNKCPLSIHIYTMFLKAAYPWKQTC